MATRKTAPAKPADTVSAAEAPAAEAKPQPKAKAKAERKEGSWLRLTYDGSAKDTHTVPQKLRIGEDGKPMKRKVSVPAKVEYRDMPVYDLWGIKFPTGETLEFEHDGEQFGRGKPSMAKLAIKARNLGCFKVECDPCLEEDEHKRARERRKLRRA